MAPEALLEKLKFLNVDARISSEHLPTMYDLPSEDPEEPGLPDTFHPLQAFLLTQTFRVLVDFFTGIDLNLYYDKDHTNRYKRPDWFAVLGVSKLFEGAFRRSYVIWQEKVRPFIAVEFLSPGTEDEDLGHTAAKEDGPPTKWEVYERILQIPYYVVYDRETGAMQAFHLENGRYRQMDVRGGRIAIPEIELELRVWRGTFSDHDGLWLRWYDGDGRMIPTPAEQAALESAAKERERVAKERETAAKEEAIAAYTRERAEKERLRALLEKAGIDPGGQDGSP